MHYRLQGKYSFSCKKNILHSTIAKVKQKDWIQSKLCSSGIGKTREKMPETRTQLWKDTFYLGSLYPACAMAPCFVSYTISAWQRICSFRFLILPYYFNFLKRNLTMFNLLLLLMTIPFWMKVICVLSPALADSFR